MSIVARLLFLKWLNLFGINRQHASTATSGVSSGTGRCVAERVASVCRVGRGCVQIKGKLEIQNLYDPSTCTKEGDKTEVGEMI